MPAAFPDRSGIVKLTSGVILSPVDHITFDLPNGYRSFELEFTEVMASAEGSWSISLSQDGGATYINDFVNFDSYSITQTYAVRTGANAEVAIFDDSLIGTSVSYGANDTMAGSLLLKLSPGSAQVLPSFRAEAFSHDVNNVAPISTIIWAVFSGWVKANATAPPSLIRTNKLRIDAAYGTGEIGTGGVNFTNGSYALYGKS